MFNNIFLILTATEALLFLMDSSYPDPSLIGKAFVKQYYTQLHHDPSQMHRFYLEQSSMVHGGSELGSAERVIGQKVAANTVVLGKCSVSSMNTWSILLGLCTGFSMCVLDVLLYL